MPGLWRPIGQAPAVPVYTRGVKLQALTLMIFVSAAALDAAALDVIQAHLQRLQALGVLFLRR